MSNSHKVLSKPQQLSLLGASKGGRARAAVLSETERKDIARAAARARWGKQTDIERALEETTEPASKADPSGMPYSIFQGTVTFGDMVAECHVLNDFRRVFTQREIVRVLSGGRDSGNLQRYLGRNPLTIDLADGVGKTLHFLIPPGRMEAIGYEATHLVEICDKYMEAYRQKLLKPSQYKLVRQAEIVMRSCAKVGIIALIDEATGFQKVRAEHALQIKLQAFIADELQEWARMFPTEFWYELARLEGIRYSPRARPLRWGRYIMMFVYDAIDEDVGNELRAKIQIRGFYLTIING